MERWTKEKALSDEVLLRPLRGLWPGEIIMYEPKEHKFKEGEWAWSPVRGWDKVVFDEMGGLYSIKHGGTTYTECGKYRSEHFHPILLTEEQANKLGYFREKKKVKKERIRYAVVDITDNEPLCCSSKTYADTDSVDLVLKSDNADKWLRDWIRDSTKKKKKIDNFRIVQLTGTYEIEE